MRELASFCPLGTVRRAQARMTPSLRDAGLDGPFFAPMARMFHSKFFERPRKHRSSLQELRRRHDLIGVVALVVGAPRVRRRGIRRSRLPLAQQTIGMVLRKRGNCLPDAGGTPTT